MFEIKYLNTVIKKHIPVLAASSRIHIKQAIEEKLMVDPIGFGKPLRYSLKGHRRLRVGDYRVVYKIENNIVTIIAIKHRKEIYK